jgi:hypothetical protein
MPKIINVTVATAPTDTQSKGFNHDLNGWVAGISWSLAVTSLCSFSLKSEEAAAGW